MRRRNDWSARPGGARLAGAQLGGLAGPAIPLGMAEMAGLPPDGKPAGSTQTTSVFTEFDEARFDERFAGRFDPTPQCRYPYCYAALDDLTAICEVLLRDVSAEGTRRFVPWKTVENYQLTVLETRETLWLVSLLDAADLAAALQDSWLVQVESPDGYEITRRWGHWLRESKVPGQKGPGRDDPKADGLVWRSKREPGGRSVLLFGDQCRGRVVYSPFGVRPLDHGEGLEWLNRRLGLLRARVRVSSTGGAATRP